MILLLQFHLLLPSCGFCALENRIVAFLLFCTTTITCGTGLIASCVEFLYEFLDFVIGCVVNVHGVQTDGGHFTASAYFYGICLDDH